MSTSEKNLQTNDGSAESDIATEVNVASNSEMIELEDPGNLLESLLELLDLNIEYFSTTNLE